MEGDQFPLHLFSLKVHEGENKEVEYCPPGGKINQKTKTQTKQPKPNQTKQKPPTPPQTPPKTTPPEKKPKKTQKNQKKPTKANNLEVTRVLDAI